MKEYQRFAFSLPAGMRAKLDAIAEAEDRSIASIVRRFIEQGLDARDEEAK